MQDKPNKSNKVNIEESIGVEENTNKAIEQEKKKIAKKGTSTIAKAKSTRKSSKSQKKIEPKDVITLDIDKTVDGTESEKDNKAVASKTKAARKTTSKSSTKTTKSVGTKTTTRSRKTKSTASSSKKSESSKDKNKVIAKDSLQVKTEQIKNKVDKVAKRVDKMDLTNFNTYLFHKGNNYESYNILGSHVKTENKHKGVQFVTWAPNAMEVYVVGDFNEFEVRDEYKLEKITENGLWNGFFTEAKQGDKYKYCIVGQDGQMGEYKADPYAICTELRPGNASIIYEPEDYKWNDKSWIDKRNKANVLEQPLNIYEMHLGSWKTNNEGGFLTYEEISEELPAYLKEMGYTHVEIMPLVEHPLDASWGYQGTGYYSPTSRYGKLEGLKTLVDKLHEANIGVIMDWAPGHFCKDAHGLYKFDGSATYEYQEEWRAENKGWGTCNFDLGRCEVKSYLISNALYWLREFHVDGLRVDAVSSILYLDYSRKQGEWVPNKYGGNGSLEAIEFLKELNTAVFAEYPTALMIAEESTSWPNVTKPPVHDGLGFNLKWNMGWMNDTLEYIEMDPKYRKDNHRNITFAMMYNYAENYVLPLSHDEVVHGKKSLVEKMWGDEWNKFAGLRTFIGYMMGHPGKKLLFMGNEFAQRIEWREYESLQWNLINELEIHKQTQLFFKDLNHLYLDNKAFWELDHDYRGFNWIEADNSEQSVLIFARRSRNDEDTLIFIINFTSKVYYDYQIGVPFLGVYEELFNTDDSKYGGSGQIMGTDLVAEKEGFQKQPYSLKIKVPPMATLILKIKEIKNEKEVDELRIDE
ncbi:1,4-alpha-glucan branching protein GlgB [Clostridium saccharobutylicum]|uniref:1,4-alpha-glucan branching enzyme GlgB n=1 Tax=Clostridium saccharobutylicum TaxID=169679 RepID=A0A1S8NJW8_CLOSA|nr:1,4-alpha-glucan branching protein GlgB [Clostridium saccharobutylicum]OOM16672.1 1,4-alpha-glucan branching enzyme GlgB [Clostridium saccharobutylicum]